MAGSEAVSHYRKMLANGCTERFAEMCSVGIAPGTKGSDRALMEGRLNGEWLNALPARQAARMLREAKAAGISTSGKMYMGGLADKRAHLDPAAWVDSAADIKKVAAARNLEVQGIVTHRSHEVEPVAPKDINDSILKAHVARERKKNPTAKTSDLVEKVKDKIVPHFKRKK
jgi:hypothetical protein